MAVSFRGLGQYLVAMAPAHNFFENVFHNWYDTEKIIYIRQIYFFVS